MDTILHIWANPRPLSQSYSLKVAGAFLDRYRQLRPEDEIIDLDLYQQDIPFVDEDILKCWDPQGGCTLAELSREGRAKIQALEKLVERFIEADKYIFVTPMWNLSVPPMMKAFFDCVCISGKTFMYTDDGPVGLLKDKKAVHIQARGGVYSQGHTREFELGDRYVRTILAFMGVTDVESVIVEGMAQTPERAEEILQAAMARAREAAERFTLGPVIPAVETSRHSVHPIH